MIRYTFEVHKAKPREVVHCVPVIHKEFGYWLYDNGEITAAGSDFFSERAANLFATQKMMKRQVRDLCEWAGDAIVPREGCAEQVDEIESRIERISRLIDVQAKRDLERLCQMYKVIPLSEAEVQDESNIVWASIETDEQHQEIFGERSVLMPYSNTIPSMVVLDRFVNTARYWFYPTKERLEMPVIQIGYTEGEYPGDNDANWYIEMGVGFHNWQTLYTCKDDSVDLRAIAEQESRARGGLEIVVVSFNDNGRSRPARREERRGSSQ